MSIPLILITNDDGINAKGLRTLVEIMTDLGDIIVVAPDKAQSGMGHAITIGDTLRLNQVNTFGSIKAWSCSGTSADCIKLAKSIVLKNKPPDLVVSGINHGSNSAISILYSGTMSAAIEAAIEEMPAIGFSLCDLDHNADFSHCKSFVKKIALQVLKTKLPKGVALNVNIPAKSGHPIKGIKICRQARAKWKEEFIERKDPSGKSYFWMTGDFINLDKGEDTDEFALTSNYVSIVPCEFDLTAHHAIAILNDEWEL